MGRRSGGSLLLWLLDIVMFVLTLCVSVSLVAAYISPCVDPSRVWYFAFFGLFFPVFYIANIILGLYWALRWKRTFFLCALVFLIGIGNISSFYKFSFAKQYAKIKEAGSIKVLTYNVAAFWGNDGSGSDTHTAKDVLGFIKEEDPDIICFQEFSTSTKYPRDYVDKELSDWKYKFVSDPANRKIKLAVYSKYPIISKGEMSFPETGNTVLYGNVKVDDDTIRVINSHLHITHVDRDNVRFIDEYGFSLSEESKVKMRQIAGRLRRGFTARSEQADSVAVLIRSSDIPTVVCGDFNDTPMSYAYRTIRGDYQDTFVNKGNGKGYTYKQLHHMLRIDFILHSNSLGTVSYDSPNVPWSDHNPVTAIITLPAAK